MSTLTCGTNCKMNVSQSICRGLICFEFLYSTFLKLNFQWRLFCNIDRNVRFFNNKPHEKQINSAEPDCSNSPTFGRHPNIGWYSYMVGYAKRVPIIFQIRWCQLGTPNKFFEKIFVKNVANYRISEGSLYERFTKMWTCKVQL